MLSVQGWVSARTVIVCPENRFQLNEPVTPLVVALELDALLEVDEEHAANTSMPASATHPTRTGRLFRWPEPLPCIPYLPRCGGHPVGPGRSGMSSDHSTVNRVRPKPTPVRRDPSGPDRDDRFRHL